MADRIAMMMDGDVVQIGTPQELHDGPADTRVARFIGTPAINLLPGAMAADGTVRILGLTAPVAEARTRSGACDVEVGVRAENVRLCAPDAPGALSATVRRIEYLGSDALLHLTADLAGTAHPVVARVASEDLRHRPGDTVGLCAPERSHVFGLDGRRVPLKPAERAAMPTPQVAAT